MAIVSVASADSVKLSAPVMEISGTTTINTITGVGDGQYRTVIPTGAWAFGGAGNVSASTVAQTVDVPVVLLCRNGILYQVGPAGHASTGSGSLVRATSPTIVTPTIADLTNAQHDHSDADDGGQIGSSAIAASEKTGSGDIVCAVGPTIDDPTITTRIRLPGPVYIYSGSGTPEGNVAAPVGSTFQRTDGGASTSFYVKESGSATSSGWVGK